MTETVKSNGERLHDGPSEAIRRMGYTSLQQNNAEANKMDIYRKNIDPYIEKGSRPGYGGFGDCLVTVFRGGTAYTSASKTVAGHLCEIVGLNGKVKIVVDDKIQDEEDFSAGYIQSDHTIHLHINEDRFDREFDRDKTEKTAEESIKAWEDFQLRGKYDNFYRIATAVWVAHQFEEREKYKSFTPDMLADEATLFAIHATVCGMQQEEEYLRRHVNGVIDRRPRGNLTAAKRLASIESILDKFDATLDNFWKVSAKINKRNEALN